MTPRTSLITARQLLLAATTCLAPNLLWAQTATEPGAPSAATPAVSPPILLEPVAAELPDELAPARRLELLLQLTVGTDGTVSDVAVLDAEQAGDAADTYATAAVAAVSRFRFEPARRAGEPVAVRIQYRFAFDPEPEPTVQQAEAELEAAPPTPSAPPEAPIASGTFSGRALERGTRKPLVGAVVQLPELGRETLTDKDGRFDFGAVPVGKVEIVIEDVGHARVLDHEPISADQSTDVVYYLEQTSFSDDDLVVVDRRAQKEVTHHTISTREINTVAGTNGDALKAVQNMPGAARTNGENIILRGGGNTQVFVNGLPIPAAFHFFGLRSTVGSGLLKSVEVTPGNYQARYGRGNGGVVDLELRRPADDGFHGFGQVDLFDASAFLEGPVGDNASFAVGLRRSYIDSLLPLVLDEDGKRTFQAAPRYYDMQAAYDWQSGRHRFRSFILGSSDSIQLLLDPDQSDPAVRGNLSYDQDWISGQALWDFRISEETQHHMALSYMTGHTGQFIGRDLEISFTPHQIAFRDELTHHFTDWLDARAGADVLTSYADFNVNIPLPPKEGQIESPLSSRPTLHTKDTALNVNPAAWVAADLQFGALTLSPALRVDYFSKQDKLSGDLVVQPRLDARYALTERTVIKGAVGLYSEPPELDEANDVFGNPEAQPDLSRQYSAGVEQQLSDAIALNVTGFYKDLYNTLSPSQDPEQVYDNNGRGRAYGSEVLLRHDMRSRFFGWVGYTLMRSERKDSGANDYRLFDVDQTHNLTAVGQFKITPTWDIGARFRYVTGNPKTPVVGATFDSDADAYVPIYGEHNSSRSGAFHQLDVRVDKHFIFDQWKLTAYLDVQNIYNRQNPEGESYNYDYSESRVAAGLPLIPSFGVKGEF